MKTSIALFAILFISSICLAVDLKHGLAIVTDSKTKAIHGKEIYEDAIYELLYSLEDHLINADIISSSDVLDGALSYYRAVIIPSQTIMTDEEIKAYGEYLSEDGYIIATYDSSLKTGSGELRENLGLGDYLGLALDKKQPDGVLSVAFSADFFKTHYDAETPLTNALIVDNLNGKAIASFMSAEDNEVAAAIVITEQTAYFAENLYFDKTSNAYTEALIEILQHFLGEGIQGGFFRLSIDDIKETLDSEKGWYKTIERELKKALQGYADVPKDSLDAYEDAIPVYAALRFSERNNFGDKAGLYLQQLQRLTERMIPGILQTRTAEARAVWIDYQSFEASETEEDFRNIIRKLATANINMIFPETIYNGATLYRSKVGFQKENYQALSFDPLAVIIDEAHSLGIEVHPWVWVFCGGYWNEFGPTLKANPEWIELDERGEPFSNWEYKTAWYNASHPEVRAHLFELFNELVTNYPIDGLHIDYIRYNEDAIGHFGFSDYSKEMFFNETGLILDEIKIGSKEWIAFNTFRENNVTYFVEELREMLKETNPELLLSAAVVPDPEHSRQNVLQNWQHWVQNGYLDFVMTMDYRNDTSGFKGNAKKGLDLIQDKAWVYPGLGLYVNDRINNIGQIKSTREVGSTGVALFSNISFWKEKYDDAVNGLFMEKAILPMREPLKAAVSLLHEASKKFEKASLESLANKTNRLADEVLLYEPTLQDFQRLGQRTATLLEEIENLKIQRLIRTLEVEPLAADLVAIARIANICTFQLSDKTYVPPTPRTN